jgi:hypothetical protein
VSFHRQRDPSPYIGVWGQEVTADNTREGVVDDGLTAYEERVVEARRQWPEAQAADFEQIGKRRWRDRASGTEYRHVDGTPLLSIGVTSSVDVSVFFVADGRLIFLRRADLPEGSTVSHGSVIAQEIVGDWGGRVR